MVLIIGVMYVGLDFWSGQYKMNFDDNYTWANENTTLEEEIEGELEAPLD